MALATPAALALVTTTFPDRTRALGIWTAVLPGQVLYGAGLGAGSVAATAAGTAALPREEQGLASGLLNTAAQVGTALGLAVLVAVAATADVPVDGFRAAFAADGALAAAAAIALRLRVAERHELATRDELTSLPDAKSSRVDRRHFDPPLNARR